MELIMNEDAKSTTAIAATIEQVYNYLLSLPPIEADETVVSVSSLMKMENVRILKEVRNSINRKVNCETANLNKTAFAAAKQSEDIMFIQETLGIAKLPEGLQEIAQLRLENPEASLKELADLCTAAIGRSGVNHRLRKLSEIAEELRGDKEE